MSLPGPELPNAPPEARIYGESAYDRVTSLLLAVVMGALLVFGWLSIIAATTSAYQARVTQPIEVIEVSGGGGGTPEGKPGELRGDQRRRRRAGPIRPRTTRRTPAPSRSRPSRPGPPPCSIRSRPRRTSPRSTSRR